jgi:hypothetical protein
LLPVQKSSQAKNERLSRLLYWSIFFNTWMHLQFPKAISDFQRAPEILIP